MVGMPRGREQDELCGLQFSVFHPFLLEELSGLLEMLLDVPEHAPVHGTADLVHGTADLDMVHLVPGGSLVLVVFLEVPGGPCAYRTSSRRLLAMRPMPW